MRTWSISIGGAVLMAMASFGAAAAVQTPFDNLDEDGDRYISRDETRGDMDVARHWYKYDQDMDGQLSEVEFSALEEAQSKPAPWEYLVEPSLDLNSEFYR